MSETQSTIVQHSNTTENYAVFEAAEVAGSQAITGMYVSLAAFGEEPPEFLEIAIGDEGTPLVKNKDTKNYGVYESESGAISGMYVSHDLLNSEETEDGFEAPADRGLDMSVATESDFEESQEDEALQNEAEGLLSDSGSDDGVEVEEDDGQTDEEAEAEELLDEALDEA